MQNFCTMLNEKSKKCVNDSVLCWLATTNEYSIPNVSPKEMFTYFNDDTLLIANIDSPQSSKNIKTNSNVCVSFINIFIQKGYKVVGKALIINENDNKFLIYKNRIIDLYGNEFKILEIFEVSILRINDILAPSYIIKKDITEEEQIKSAYKTYGIKDYQGK